MAAAARFNRFHLAFGLGYDFLQRVEDSYPVFLYPFLMDVPGFMVGTKVEAAGITTVKSPADMGATVARVLGRAR